MGITEVKKLLFRFFRLEFFTNCTFNTFVGYKEELPAILLISLVSHSVEDDNDSLSAHCSDNKSPPL